MGVSLELPVSTSSQGDLVFPVVGGQSVELVVEDQLAGGVPFALDVRNERLLIFVLILILNFWYVKKLL